MGSKTSKKRPDLEVQISKALYALKIKDFSSIGLLLSSSKLVIRRYRDGSAAAYRSQRAKKWLRFLHLYDGSSDVQKADSI
jgi:hypothetical protein